MEKSSALERMQSETAYFKNVCKYTVKNIFKFQIVFLLKKPAIYLLPFATIITFVIQNYTIALLMAIFTLVYYTVLPLTYYQGAKRTVKLMAERNGGEVPENTVTFTESALYNTTSGKTVGVEYGAVKRVMTFKDSYYVVTKTNQAFLVSKNGFVLGNPADFPAFIKEKTEKKVKA